MSLKKWVVSRYSDESKIAWVAFILEAISVIFLFGLMLLTCLDVGGRYLFNNSIDGSIELTQIGLAIMIFSVLPVITWRERHVVVDLIDGFISNKVIKVLSLTSAFLISLSLFVVAIRIIELGQRNMRREVVTEFLKIPEGYIIFYIALMCMITAAMMATYGMYRIVKSRNKE